MATRTKKSTVEKVIKDYKKYVAKAHKDISKIHVKTRKINYLAIAHFDLPQSTSKKIRFGQKKIIQEMLIHNQICRYIIEEEYDGIVIKELGDAVLAKFHNAGIACECALNIIHNLRKYGNGICTKVAISDGIVEEWTTNKKNDVYGVPVDLCSRMTKYASRDSVLVHDTVFSHVETLLKDDPCVKLGKGEWKSLKDFNRVKLHTITLRKNKKRTHSRK